MKTKIVRIGNSRGVRIPKPLLEQAGLEDEVSLRVTEEGIVIEARSHPRDGWADAAKRLHGREEDGLLDEWQPTAFDESEWEWQ
jgi:antitoxin MazE